MELAAIVIEIDKEIARLQEARTLLSGEPARPKRGRPKSTGVAAKQPKTRKKGVRRLSPEGRKRIAEAMKRRWAERKKLAAAKK
ncbi:MAG TPA: hypothetical protein VGD64_03020 [Acidisarcina sp.]